MAQLILERLGLIQRLQAAVVVLAALLVVTAALVP
jgi:hypothetical protein